MITWSMPGKSKPRAATSVATKTWVFTGNMWKVLENMRKKNMRKNSKGTAVRFRRGDVLKCVFNRCYCYSSSKENYQRDAKARVRTEEFDLRY